MKCSRLCARFYVGTKSEPGISEFRPTLAFLFEQHIKFILNIYFKVIDKAEFVNNGKGLSGVHMVFSFSTYELKPTVMLLFFQIKELNFTSLVFRHTLRTIIVILSLKLASTSNMRSLTL